MIRPSSSSVSLFWFDSLDGKACLSSSRQESLWDFVMLARMVGFEATIWFEPSWECIDFVVIIILGCKFEGKERERWVQEK